MKVLIAILFVLFSALLPTVEAQEGWGQIAFQNDTNVTGDLYIGEAYGCRAMGNGGMCPTQVRVGVYAVVTARFTDGDRLTWTNVPVAQGQVTTLRARMQ